MPEIENLSDQPKQPVQVQIPGFDFNKAFSLAEKFIGNQQVTTVEALKIEDAENERQHKFDVKILDFDRLRFLAQFGLVAIISLVLLGVAVVLFFNKETNSAVLIVSHLGAVLLGLMAGMGIDKSKRKEYVKEETEGS